VHDLVLSYFSTILVQLYYNSNTTAIYIERDREVNFDQEKDEFHDRSPPPSWEEQDGLKGRWKFTEKT